jgi:hypothetical protein
MADLPSGEDVNHDSSFQIRAVSQMARMMGGRTVKSAVTVNGIGT